MSFTNLGVPPQPLEVYPPWSARLVEKVDRALCEAWSRLIRDHSPLAHSGDEDIITHQLKRELAAIRREGAIKGFNDGVFGVPVRDARVMDCYGESVDQTPDLTIYLAKCRPGISDDEQDGLFFECKVLDDNRGLDLYRANGIERFISGRYAWRMPHAGMLAYVLKKGERSATAALTNYAKGPRPGGTRGAQMGMLEPPEQVAPSLHPLMSEIAQTRHVRRAPVNDGRTTMIAIRHIWFCTEIEQRVSGKGSS